MSDHNKCPSSEKEHEKCIFRLSYFHRIEPIYIVRFPINHGYLLPGAAAWLPPVPVLAAAEFPGGRLPPGLGHGGQHAAHGGGAGPGAQAGHAVQDAPGHRALAKQVRGVLPCNRWSILALFLTIIFVDTSTEVF